MKSKTIVLSGDQAKKRKENLNFLKIINLYDND